MAKEKVKTGSLLERLKKNSTVKLTDILLDSKFFNDKDVIPMPIYALNVAFAGDLFGGFVPGVTTWAGPSKHFKSLFSLLQAKAYMDKYADAVLLFYDCEFGTPVSYFKSVGIDMSRVMHTPILNIEELKFDMMQQLEGINRGDHIITIIDSIGNIASKKEVEDALDGKSVSDMTRAKQLKSIFRMITPHYNIKDIPLVVINHTYQTQEMFSKTVVSGGCLLAGSKICMSDNTYKAIENINVGEKVKTLLGDRIVTFTWNPDTLIDGTPDCYEIEFEDGYKVTCSENHKFLIDGEWIEAKDLQLNDNVTTL